MTDTSTDPPDLPTGRALVEHVAALARQVATGQLECTENLAVAANTLQAAWDYSNGSRYLGPYSDLANDDDRVNLRNMLWPPHSRGAVAVPAGRIRAAFGRGRRSAEEDAAGWLVHLLPTTLPEQDDALVLLHKTRGLYRLLSSVAAGQDPQPEIDRLADYLTRTPPTDMDLWLAATQD